MRWMVMVVALLSGCGSLHDSLQGRWTIDLDAMIAADPEMQKAEENHPEMIAEIREQMRHFTLEFGEDTVVLTSSPTEQKSGHYQVLSEEDAFITIRATLGEEPEETLRFEFKDDDHLRATAPGDDPAMHLKRL